MRPESEYREAVELINPGVNDCEIGRRLGIPRGTVRDWRVGLNARSGGRTKEWSGRRHSTCFRCDGGWVDEEAHSYLLGVYLEDGCLSPHRRDVYRLQIACDLKYPDIINEIASHIVIVRGVDRVGFARSTGCTEVERQLSAGPKRYRYARYMFTNASTDILSIFTDALDALGVHWTQTTARVISVTRREDVAFLDTFVGPKS